MYWTLRSTGYDNYGWLLFLRSLSDIPVLYCREDTGQNLHYHYLFCSNIEERSKLLGKKNRFLYVPSEHNQFPLQSEKIRLPIGKNSFCLTPLRGTIEDYKKYLCKGYDVRTKNLQNFFNTETGMYIGEPPVVYGMSDSEILENHNAFWKQFSDNNHKYHNVKEKKQTISGIERFLSFYDSAEVKFHSNEEGLRRCREHLKYIIELAYQYCKRMSRDSVDIAVSKLVHACMLAKDDTGEWEKQHVNAMYDRLKICLM